MKAIFTSVFAFAGPQGTELQMLLMIDNYDSFTFNITRYFQELGEDVKVVRNDQMSVSDVMSMRPSRVVISPGPGKPDSSGISRDIIKCCAGQIPVLGVCLGHQCIAEVFGATIGKAAHVMHGKTSAIEHQGKGIFDSVERSFMAMRYHSLVVRRDGLPGCLEVTAWAANEIMGIQHRDFPAFGVQFHPESVLSEHGHQIFKNFLAQS